MTKFHRAWMIAALAALGFAAPATAAELEGVDFAERLDAGNTELFLHGTGLLRYRVLFKGYVAALYLEKDAASAAALEDSPRRLEISYFWSIDADDFAEATIEGISRNVDAKTLAALRDRIDRLNRLYEDIEPGDRYALTYLPGIGTELSKNEVPKGRIPGADFAEALFAIWLGENPLDIPLRDQLLRGR